MALPNSNSAAHAVFAIHELLGDIVGLLSVGEIVIATGVCQTWRKTLKANLTIQRAIYLAPVHTREIVTTKNCLSERIGEIDRDEYAVVTEPNPFIKRVCDQMDSCTKLHSSERSAYQEYQPQPKFKHPNGTWRDMFISQPPINLVNIEVFLSSNFYTAPDRTLFFCARFAARQLTLKHDQGITMGKLHDFIQSTALPGLRKPVFVRLSVPQEHFLERSITVTDRYQFWCEVRDGKVSRQTQPPHLLIDPTAEDEHEIEVIDLTSDEWM